MLSNIFLTINVIIAIANGFILMRCWRTMREVDKLHAEAVVLKERFQKLNPDYVDFPEHEKDARG